ncbi:hypothetical protein VKA52_04810 [Halobacillus sp. HZG1]|uniref:hypothetical protein n=1 Tax=Halobacillus sp. HZG1 TaxID=3111769 RepID=UPI002DB69D1E|nr:hypothetical protein [Halobacillus sp. HZG1]MEC3883052.1 hypothetical protein [Halobacillus sp. HZG1]
MKVKILGLLILILLLGCSDNLDEQTRVSIQEDESYVAYVKEEGIHLLAPTVWLEHDHQETSEPFLVTFELSDELQSVLNEDYKVTFDSQDIFKGNPDFKNQDTFFVGNNLTLKKSVSQEALRKMVSNGDIKVLVTELNGDVITSIRLQKLLIGQPDGSVVKP